MSIPTVPDKHDLVTLNPTADLTHSYLIQRTKPDPKFEQLCRDAIGYLVFKWSFFSQLIYDGMSLVYTNDPAVPIAATDHFNIFISQEGMLKNDIDNIPQVAFVQAHEVSHRVFNDIPAGMIWEQQGYVMTASGKRLPYVSEVMGWAADYRINAMLVSSKVGTMPKVGLYDPTLSKAGMESSVEIYEKLITSGRVKLIKGGFDVHLKPGDSAVAKDVGRREHQIQVAAELAKRANQQGSIPGAISRLIDEMLDPKVRWQDHLKSTMVRKAGEPKLDWRKRNRRLVSRDDPLYFAASGRRGAGVIVAGIDTSGSITQPMLDQFFAEAAAICSELNPLELVVIWCDAAINRVDRLDEPTDLLALKADIAKTGLPGGGGTSFVPVFDRIEELNLKPDMLVYFTDSYGRFPDSEPAYPVIWACIIPEPKVPFGEVVYVEI